MSAGYILEKKNPAYLSQSNVKLFAGDKNV